ncbi:MAG: alpha amylase C-terminal domain-containing protein [Leptolyngbyaceae cyanobacterium]
MDIIAICLACQLAAQPTAQLPTTEVNVSPNLLGQGFKQPIEFVLSAQESLRGGTRTGDQVISSVATPSIPIAEVEAGETSPPLLQRLLQSFMESLGLSDDSKVAAEDLQEGENGLETVVEVSGEDDILDASLDESAADTGLGVVDEEMSVEEIASEVDAESGSLGMGDASSSDSESELVSVEESLEDIVEEVEEATEAEASSRVTSPLFANVGDRQNYVISPDVAFLQLASAEALGREPGADPSDFHPATGATFNDDGTLTLKVLVGNSKERFTVIGDFNNWGNGVDLSPYQLYPSAADPNVHEAILPVGNYHKAQYRLRDQDGRDRLDMSAPLFSTPAFNERFYDYRQDNNLNAVLWQRTPIPAAELAPTVDLRGQQLVIAETDIVSLALKWSCVNSDSKFYGQTGADNIVELYSFVGECGLPEEMASLGYNAVQFMPLDTHVDFWTPESPYFPDWRFGYITINYYGKHADFGSPDELAQMINAFHKADVAVLLDVVYSHYSDTGNEPPREFYPLGFSQYHREDGWELYGGPWTEWGTRRFTYSPEIRRNLIEAALINVLDYGFDGLRVDNVNGIDSQPYGRDFLRELSAAVDLYQPKAVVIGEGYFGDWYLNRARGIGGAGLLTTYSDRFYLWFTENIIKYRDEIDTGRLDYMLSWDWPRALLYYPGNHDEFANPGNPFQTRGRYLAEAIQGGIHTQKIQSWSALTLFASSYYLDMVQLWTLQPGNLNNNSPIDWARFEYPEVKGLAQFQSDMKHFFASEAAFAPYNIHHNMLRWVDSENKVVVFERIDFATGRRVYVVINLGDRAIDHYKIGVHPDGASFHMALDSDLVSYGGSGNNQEWLTSDNRELEFFLGSYGVVGLVQQDKLEPVGLDAASGGGPDPEFRPVDWYAIRAELKARGF